MPRTSAHGAVFKPEAVGATRRPLALENVETAADQHGPCANVPNVKRCEGGIESADAEGWIRSADKMSPGPFVYLPHHAAASNAAAALSGSGCAKARM
ncbi:MAG: hypothetical protein CMF03_02305 [Hyphomonas sp.]|nr:hypothetical protein [Hyphomonas sp.]